MVLCWLNKIKINGTINIIDHEVNSSWSLQFVLILSYWCFSGREMIMINRQIIPGLSNHNSVLLKIKSTRDLSSGKEMIRIKTIS